MLVGCANNQSVYWCGDHACVNEKEKEAYFKKTMIVEMREIGKKKDNELTELEKIKERARLEERKRIKGEKKLYKEARLEEKKRIKGEKKLYKEARLEEKKRIKEEKKLAKEIQAENKMIIKKEKKVAKKPQVKKKKKTSNEIKIEKVNKVGNSSYEFIQLVEKINEKNKLKPYPDINDIPN